MVERVRLHKFLKFISSRFFITAVLILVQVAWMVMMFSIIVGNSELFSSLF